MKKILFLLPSLGGGGAERVVTYLANGFSQLDGLEVTLLLLNKNNNDYISLLDKKVKVEYLVLNSRLRFCIPTVLKAIVSRKPNIVFIGYDTLNYALSPFIIALKIRGIKIVVRETNILSKRFKPNFLNRIIYRSFYKNYDSIICQSNDMKNDMSKVWKIKTKKITVINNPIDIKVVQKKASLPINHIHVPDSQFFIAIGRLSSQKGFDRLIELINILNKKNKFPFYLIILGDGSQRTLLDNMIKSYSIANKVYLLGRLDNPYNIIAKSKGLILSSKFEGFPNVLLEANALGIPILSNRCPGGIDEIIVEGKNGITANFDDEQDFENKFDQFLKTDFDSQTIIEMTKQRYDISVIFPQYNKLIRNV